MDTDERGTRTPGESHDAGPATERWRKLSEHLGDEVARARADAARAHADRDRAEALLRAAHLRQKDGRIAALVAERERQTAELLLARARAYIERTLPMMRTMRILLASMQDSKFWKARNAWFALKQRARLNASGPQPYWVPTVDDAEAGWDEEFPYERWLLANRVRPSDVERMRDVVPLLAVRPTFSVLMPVYETPEEMLREAIESVLAQPYPHWELCIADDASRAPHVRHVLEEYAAADGRVRVAFRETNGHIAATSNSALALATGDFIALLDHDDLLAPDALFENALVVNRRPDVDLIYSDEDKIDEQGRRSEPYFKPDWSPESVLARNYVSHLGVYRRALVERLGGFRLGFEGSQDYDLLLRFTELTDKIEHVPRVLYHWRVHAGSTASARDQKGFAQDAALRAIGDALERRGEAGTVTSSQAAPGIYTVRYAIPAPGRVSIIMPTRDHGADVDLALRTVFERSTYPDFEVVLLDNGSRDPESLRIFGKWAAAEPERLKIVPYDVPFNFSRINNHAAEHATGTYLLFLNNDTEVVTADWMEAMVEQAQRPPIGCVGAKLLYDDDTVQHAGVVVGLGGVAGHSHKHYPAAAPGYFYTLQTVNNYSAVTAACMMMRRDVFERAGGFDEALAIAFNDVDLCLRVREAGYRNVYLPHVVLYHHESKSRGYEDTAEKMARFADEQKTMLARWRTADAPDPYYNPNLTLMTEDYAIRP
ncbi:MAG: putative glycosyltransferase [Candidatus Eremiobacteraeota bacterium]|nr:putative glycosyltransferase [Candidatus Eremiobacteraeota bacterium]